MTIATEVRARDTRSDRRPREAPIQHGRVTDRLASYVALVCAVAFNLYQLYPEVAIRIPRLNDDVLHLLALRQTVDSLLAGRDATDSWLSTIGLGFPLFHHYQQLAYWPPAVIYLALQNAVGLADVLDWTRYLLLAVFPLSIYWSVRRFGFDRLTATMAGLCASLVATNGLMGFEFGSYVWRGSGLYTQVWGMFLLPLALAEGYATLRSGRGYFWVVLLLAATILSHLIMGYIALGSLVVLALVAAPTPREIWPRLKRLVLMVVPVGLVTSYFVVEFMVDSRYMNRSIWELPEKYNSYGHAWVLDALIHGELFDHGRIPVLSLLAGVGLLVSLCHWRDARYRFPAALSIVWLLLFFGRPTWGGLLGVLPMSGDLHFHRLIAGVHLAGIYLAGFGLAFAWRWLASRRRFGYVAVPAALTVLVLLPAYRERVGYLTEDARLMTESRVQLDAQQSDITELIATLRAAPPGRVYAGLGANWGANYRVGYIPMYGVLNAAGLDMVGYLYHALSLNSDVEVLFNEVRPEQYDVFNIRYVVAPRDHVFPDFVKPVRDFGQHRLYEVQTSGYFELVQSSVALQGDKTQLFAAASAWLKSDLPRLKQYPDVLLTAPTGYEHEIFPMQAAEVITRVPAADRTPSGQILAESMENNGYRAAVQLDGESTVILKATFDPNLRATVDGVAAPTSMVMPSYVSVRVPPGIHRIAFEYRPRPLRAILWFVGLLTLGVLAFHQWLPGSLTRVLPLLRFRGSIRTLRLAAPSPR
jgi:hypothetical protein